MKSFFKKIILLILIIIVILVIAFFILYILTKSKKFFINELVVNKDKEIIGADISSYQGDVNMNKLKKQNIEFIYIKATEGSSHQDKYFKKNWKNAKAANLLAGAYHFFSYDSSGVDQAENYIRTVGADIKGRLIPAVDVEYYGNKESNKPKKSVVIKELKEFLDVLEGEYGVKPIIYTRPSINKKYLRGHFDTYKKWMTSLDIPLNWSYKDDWYIWQYMNKKLDGYKGEESYIDLNVLNSSKNIEDLIVK